MRTSFSRDEITFLPYRTIPPLPRHHRTHPHGLTPEIGRIQLRGEQPADGAGAGGAELAHEVDGEDGRVGGLGDEGHRQAGQTKTGER